MDKRTCKFFNGTHHNECCLAGVRYDDVTTEPKELTGKALRIPCHSDPWPNASPSQLEHFDRRGKCEKYQEPTIAEIAAHNAIVKSAFKRHAASFPLIAKIKKDHKGQSWKGTDICPICKKTIHLTHAAINGYVWGKCETECCLDWME